MSHLFQLTKRNLIWLLAFVCFLPLWLQADDWNGVEYAQNSSVQLSHAERLLKGLVLKGDEHILDVGCGDGKITASLAKRVPQGVVIGIDPSESMLDKANTLCESFDHLTFKKARAEDFAFDERFDHIIAIHVMHWIQAQEKALKNIHDHLNPNGHVHFILAPSKEGLPFYTALQKTLKNWQKSFVDFVNPQQVFDIEAYRQLMVKAGFHIEGLHYLYHESTHENKEKLKAWIKQWQPHAKHLPLADREIFLNELMDQYLLEIGLTSNTLSPVAWGEYVLIVESKKSQEHL